MRAITNILHHGPISDNALFGLYGRGVCGVFKSEGLRAK